VPDRRPPIDRMIDTSGLRCTVCNLPAGTCDCWAECSCGWSHLKGRPCNNPMTTRCSSKLRFKREKGADR
jgi:hypothetical protein